VFPGPDSPHPIDGDVHPVARRKNTRARLVIRSENILTLHGSRRRPQPREAKQRGCNIDGADEPVVHIACPPAVRKPDDERHMDSAVVKKLLTAK